MTDRKDLSAQHAPTIGKTWEVTRCLSNLSQEPHGKSGVILRRKTHILSHLWVLRGSLRLIPRLDLSLEPRASSSGTASTVYGGTGTPRYGTGVVVYPGYIGRHIYQVVYTHLPTQGGIPGYIPHPTHHGRAYWAIYTPTIPTQGGILGYIHPYHTHPGRHMEVYHPIIPTQGGIWRYILLCYTHPGRHAGCTILLL